MSYAYLAAAILFEVVGTSSLRLSDGMTRLGPTVVTLAAYAVAFYLLSLTLRTVPIGLAYAIWSGVGIILISLIGVIWFRQGLDAAALVGIGLIVAGVAVIHLFSRSIAL